ncbi:MAG: creatininase [Anaerolineaceae bacterium]|nr:creatininase [Anaerolineaceae bacterium]
MKHRFENMTWPEAKAAAERGAGIILSLGSTEQHGYHLPLSTDALISYQLCLQGVAGRDFIVAPQLPYGYRSRPLSGGGPTFPGTIPLSGNTFVQTVREILDGFIQQGFRNLVIFSWHFENKNFAYEAAFLAAEDKQDVKIVVMEDPFDSLSESTMNLLYDNDFPGWPMEHAGILETAVVLELAPELVNMDRAVDDHAEYIPAYDLIPPPPTITTASGVLYKSKRATAGMGKVAVDEIVAHLGRVLDREFPQLSGEK